jgi:uncharacterized membrane-anchored protein YhcB (DUF1043 family)
MMPWQCIVAYLAGLAAGMIEVRLVSGHWKFW